MNNENEPPVLDDATIIFCKRLASQALKEINHVVNLEMKDSNPRVQLSISTSIISMMYGSQHRMIFKNIEDLKAAERNIDELLAKMKEFILNGVIKVEKPEMQNVQ